MTRHLIFRHAENQYVLIENEQVVFSIDEKELQFNSFQFYQGIYADKTKSTRIVLSSDLEDKDRIGRYIENWLGQIINKIADIIGDAEEVTLAQDDNMLEIVPQRRMREIVYYDLPVCAGNGLYTDSPCSSRLTTSNQEADYAIKLSGHSMEPIYSDGVILLVKKQEVLNEGDIAIINVNGESYCRKYHKQENVESFLAINDDQPYEKVIGSDETPVTIQGKVVGVHTET